MNRIVLSFVLATGIALALGTDALIGLLVATVFGFGIFSMLTGKLPKNLLTYFLAVTIGPFLVVGIGSKSFQWVTEMSHNSHLNRVAILLAISLVSVTAYQIRKRRLTTRPRPLSTRGAERTPLLPPTEQQP